MKLPKWITDPPDWLPRYALRLLELYVQRRTASGTMRKGAVVVAGLLLLVGCQTLKEVGEIIVSLPTTQPSPSPEPPRESPSPEPTPCIGPRCFPSPEPTPTPEPEPTPCIGPSCFPSPEPPRPTPTPSPANACAQTPCVQAPGCSSCAAYVQWALRGGHLTRGPNGLLYNDPDNNPNRRQYLDPKTCLYVGIDGVPRPRADRLFVDGEVCRPCPTPTPCPSPVATPGTPQPQATPGTCPVLVRWGGGLHAQMTPAHQGIPKSPTYAGNIIDFDSTARFGSGRGQPCNDEHHNLCTVDGEAHVHTPGPDGHCTSYRKCEDPRGPIWTLLRGGPQGQPINGGWGYRIKNVIAGTVCVRIEPRPDVQDHEGQSVRVVPGGAYTEVCVEIQ